MGGPCTDVLVLDFTWGMAGSVATMVLSDFGAEVVKIEPPTGDPFRSHASWLALNRGKQSVVLDLKTPEGREHARRLAERADVVVESFRPGVTERLGIDYATLSHANPRLVYCSITGFGQKGRLSQLKGYEGIVAAKTGRMLGFAGQTRREGPVYAAVPTSNWAASQAALWGILSALCLRQRHGRGHWVQASLLQGMLPYDFQATQGVILHQLARKGLTSIQAIPPGRSGPGPGLQFVPARTKDGHWIQFANNMARLFDAFLRVTDLWHIRQDERFRDAPDVDPEHREILRNMILNRLREKTLDEWMQLFVEDGDVAAEPFLPTMEGMKHPQMVHNQHVVEIVDPRVGPMKQLGVLADLSETPGEVRGPAPDLGEHTAAVLGRLTGEGRTPAPVSGGTTTNGQPPKYPLEGVTILDFSTWLAAPYGSSLLADLGARVIKVEPPEGDGFRLTLQGISMIKWTAGKESIQIDLKTEEGREIVWKLIARSDVLLHNYRPGVPERLGLDYETVRAIKPDIIYVYSGGYGATGPHYRRPSFHPIPGALLGGAPRQAGCAMPPPSNAELTLEEVREVSRQLLKANEGNPDPNTSMAVATGIMLALYARERTGKGQALLVTMLAANAYANADEAYDFAGRPPWAPADAECYGLHALYRLYPVREGWVFLACPFSHEWEAFCRAVGRPDLLTDPRFVSEEQRRTHDEELARELAQIFAGRSAAEWEGLLTAADVACVQADERPMGQFFDEEPHVQENAFVVPAERLHARFGPYRRHGSLVHMAGFACRYRPGILAGEQTRDILRELGYTEEQIDELWAKGVVTAEPVNPVFVQ